MEKDYIIGMDIGGTHFRVGLVDRDLHASHVKVYSSKDIYKENTIERLCSVISTYIEKEANQLSIKALGIGLPSVIDAKREYLYSSTNFPGLEGVNIVKSISEKIAIPVYIEHDAYYILSYDIWNHHLKNEGIIIGCYFGTGLGNAFYFNGKPFIGRNGTACELGHLAIPFNTFQCSCGNLGCIEMFSCGKALERLKAEYYPDEQIGNLFKNHGTEKHLLDFVEYMSVAVSAEVNILDPHYVFLGGGIVQMEGFPKKIFQERILAHTRKPYPAANLRLLFSKPGPENGIVGAAIEVFKRIDEE